MKRNVELPPALITWKTKLLDLIKDMGLTQEQFGAQVGVKRRAVCRWVSFEDASIPHKRTLKKIKILMDAHKSNRLSENTVFIPEFRQQVVQGDTTIWGPGWNGK